VVDQYDWLQRRVPTATILPCSASERSCRRTTATDRATEPALTTDNRKGPLMRPDALRTVLAFGSSRLGLKPGQSHIMPGGSSTWTRRWSVPLTTLTTRRVPYGARGFTLWCSTTMFWPCYRVENLARPFQWRLRPPARQVVHGLGKLAPRAVLATSRLTACAGGAIGMAPPAPSGYTWARLGQPGHCNGCLITYATY